MTKYREIIRLTGLGFSQRNIMASCGVAQKTVVKVQKRAKELNLIWPLDNSMTDSKLEGLLFPKEDKISSSKRMPDFAYIRKELLRNGVSKKLLWTEYMEDCRANGEEPLMYSQFCYHIQQDEQKRRATMHINRKPGEQVEVDWAGDPATVIEKMLYSVPYEYIKKTVDVRVTEHTIEIFYNHNRIVSHRRLTGRPGQYGTITEHMPQDHQKYLEWNGDRLRQWVERIGINTYTVVNAILTSKSVEQQTCRDCMGLLKLAEKYSARRLEAACQKALSYTVSPSYKSIKNILVTGSDQTGSSGEDSTTTQPKAHGITRGADYYRR